MNIKILKDYHELFDFTNKVNHVEERVTKKNEDFIHLLVDFCSTETKIFNSYRLLKSIELDLNVRKKLIQERELLTMYECAEKLSGIIYTEMEITRYKIMNPQLIEVQAKIENMPKLLEWTDNKVALVEVIYGISNSLNNGKASIKEIAECFEFFFQIDLGNYYHTLIEINNRKSSVTRYLDTLPSNLNKVLDRLNS